MVALADLLHKLILEAFLVLLLILLYRFGRPGLVKKVLLNFRTDFKRPLVNIVLPMAAAAAFVGIFLVNFGLRNLSIPLPFLIVDAVIFGPIIEELLFRGVLFGAFLKFADMMRNNAKRSMIAGFGFLIQLAIFVVIHFRFSPIEVIFLIFTGTIFSIVFLASRRNLVPAIAVHAGANLVVAIVTAF